MTDTELCKRLRDTTTTSRLGLAHAMLRHRLARD